MTSTAELVSNEGAKVKVQDVYLQAAAKERLMTDAEIASISDLLLHPESIPGELQEVLNKLSPYTVTKDIAQNPGVRKGLTALTEYFQKRKAALQAVGATIYTYGSLAYDDPINLDYDLLLVTQEDVPLLRNNITLWNNELQTLWDDIGKGGHMDYTSVDAINRNCSQLSQEALSFTPQAVRSLYWSFENGGVILAGSLVFSAGADQIRPSIHQLATQQPLLGAHLVINLKDVLHTREERRSR